MSKITRIGVVGAGQMGHGIAQVAAASGVDVVLTDVSQQALDHAMTTMTKSLDKLVSKERLSGEDRDAALGRIRTTLSIEEAAAEAQIIIEAATEREDLKLQIFGALDEHAPRGAILATNTSSISITRIGAATSRPDKVIGMHFMNPVPIMRLVEIIRGLPTSDETYERVNELAQRMGKTTVLAQDYAGFIVNRILMPMINEAVYALMEGVGSAQDIDTAMKLGTNQPMGPAHARRLYRPRHLSGDHERAPREPRRHEVSRLPAASKLRGRWLARTQVGPRLLRVRQHVARRAHPHPRHESTP